jgi:hypothetical protein
MEKIYDLKEWKFNKKIPGNKRIASVRIFLTHNDFKKVINLNSREWVSAVDKHYKGGAEVYSVLKKRKLTKKRFWNGKL